MLKRILFLMVEYIAKIHDLIMSLNDAYEYNFTDKELRSLLFFDRRLNYLIDDRKKF